MTAPLAARPKRGRPRNISRADVLDVAARLFNEQGYDRTSLDMIAEALKVTKAGLYYHIANKEEIILMGCELAIEQFRERMAASRLDGLSTAEVLKVYLRAYLDLAVSEFGRFLILVDPRALSDSAREKHLEYIRMPHQLVRALVAKGIDEGVFRRSDPDLTTSAIFGMFNWVCHWRRRPTPEQAPAIFDTFTAMLFDGILVRPA